VSQLLLNVFEYIGKPFKNGLIAVKLYDKDLQSIKDRDLYLYLGECARLVENYIGKFCVAVHHGEYIYYVAPSASMRGRIPILTSRWGKRLLTGDKVVLDPRNPGDREILRKILDRAIELHLLSQQFFVEPIGKAYKWSYRFTEKIAMQEYEIFPGFIYRPFVFEDGSCAVALDPRFKLNPRKTLREEIEELSSPEKAKEEFENTIVIDTCPILKCGERINPLSKCKLKGAGRMRLIVRLDFSRKPSEATIGDLIKYHEERVCIAPDKPLVRRLKDAPPIVIVEHPKYGFLEYPPERLRKVIRLHEIKDVWIRRILMDHIRPTPRKRADRARLFSIYLDGVRIGGITLKLRRDFAKLGESGRPWSIFGILQKPKLRFKRGITTDPLRGLEQLGPYDEGSMNEIKIAILNLSDKISNSMVEEFYKDVMFGRRGFKGLKRIYGVNIPDAKALTIYKNVKSLLTGHKDIDVCMVIIPPHQKNLYIQVKTELAKHGIATQVINDKTLAINSHKEYIGVLRNVALGIYVKAGGVPWVLAEPAENKTCFIGIDSVIRRTAIFSSIQVFDEYGERLYGHTLPLHTREDYVEFIKNELQKATEIYGQFKGEIPQNIVVHKEGDVYSFEMNAIGEALNPFKEEGASIMVLSVTRGRGIPRIYDASKEDYVIDRGVYTMLTHEEAVLVTTSSPLPLRGTPRPIVIRPYSIPADFPILVHDICKHVFYLTHLHIGYALGASAKPVTTLCADKAVKLLMRGIAVDDRKIKGAWFL